MPRQRGHASPEGLRSEKDAVSTVKHGENEQSATKTTKKHSKFDLFDVRFSCSLCFHSQHFRDLTLYHVFFCNRSYRVICVFVFLLFDTPLS